MTAAKDSRLNVKCVLVECVCSVLLLQARIAGQYYSEQLEVTFRTTFVIVISKNVKRNSHTETD